VVLKLGTRVVTHDDGALAHSRLIAIAEAAAELRSRGKEVLIVSSGALGLGRDALGLARTPTEVDERQACAAVGQTRLMSLYQEAFARMGIVCGQLLLTEADFDDRERYLNLGAALEALLRHRVVPIINENDAVSTQELVLTTGPRPVFGDNDRLSALVATKLDADLLVLFTDVRGLYDRDPRTDPDARLVPTIERLEEVGDLTPAAGSTVSRGGMRTKVEAAWVASRAGCHAVITSGREPEHWGALFAGEEVGTWFPARPRPHARQRWIAFAAAPRGRLRLDDGAIRALTERHASLLAAGVTAVEGGFRAGDVVELHTPDGRRMGRGIIAWDANTVREWCAGRPPEGIRNAHALIRRDEIVLENR
jgi:glutamate 5-kinase